MGVPDVGAISALGVPDVTWPARGPAPPAGWTWIMLLNFNRVAQQPQRHCRTAPVVEPENIPDCRVNPQWSILTVWSTFWVWPLGWWTYFGLVIFQAFYSFKLLLFRAFATSFARGLQKLVRLKARIRKNIVSGKMEVSSKKVFLIFILVSLKTWDLASILVSSNIHHHQLSIELERA